MSVMRLLYTTLLDALFPLDKAEEEVLNMEPREAWKLLPRAQDFPTPLACSVYTYRDQRMRRLVWALKYKKSLPAARIGGYALFRILCFFSCAARPIIVIPMPITRKRRRERGYNQCELVSAEIARLAAIHSRPCIHVITDLLVRERHKSRQTMKDRAERLASIHHVFAVNETRAPSVRDMLAASPNHLVMVIDDVVTTGSTMKDAIETLRTAGFQMTFGLSIAH